MEPIEPVVERIEALLAEGAEGEAEALSRLLGARLRALSDAGYRRALLRRTFEELDDAALVAVLHRVSRGAIEGSNAHRDVARELALDGTVLRELGYDRVSDLYRAAVQAGLHQVGSLFLGERLCTNVTQEEALDDNEHLPLSAGERKSAARGRNRFVLDRVVRDRDPGVIKNFLNNPRAVERDVVRIAAARPQRPEILRLLARHHRWSSRYQVRVALVGNPYTPAAIAAQLVTTLLLQDLRMIRKNVRLADRVAAAIDHAMAERTRRDEG